MTYTTQDFKTLYLNKQLPDTLLELSITDLMELFDIQRVWAGITSDIPECLITQYLKYKFINSHISCQTKEDVLRFSREKRIPDILHKFTIPQIIQAIESKPLCLDIGVFNFIRDAKDSIAQYIDLKKLKPPNDPAKLKYSI